MKRIVKRIHLAMSIIALGLLGLGFTGRIDADCLDAQTATERAVKVVVDTSEAPEVASWAEAAKKLVIEWHPIIADMLQTEGFVPAKEVKLVFQKNRKSPAATGGSTIYISANHVKQHPDDYGMVVHELVHVLQRYPKFNKENWWLVEGIADYVRFYRYEPNTRLPPISSAKASYRDGYKTSARFLAWIEKRHDKDIITQLNLALRKGEYRPELFQEWTGKGVDELWVDFRRSSPRR
jgi:Peptidase of plants and bacteria